MTQLGINTPEEMAKPPAERDVLIGSQIKFSALGLTLALNEFAEEFVDALSKANEFQPVDTMEMARDFAVKKIREQWERDWKEGGSGEAKERHGYGTPDMAGMGVVQGG